MGTLQLVRMCRPGWLGKQVVNGVFFQCPLTFCKYSTGKKRLVSRNEFGHTVLVDHKLLIMLGQVRSPCSGYRYKCPSKVKICG